MYVMFLLYFGIKYVYIWVLLFLKDNCVNILEYFYFVLIFCSKIKNILS